MPIILTVLACAGVLETSRFANACHGYRTERHFGGLVILLYKLLSRTGAGGSEKGSRRAMPVR